LDAKELGEDKSESVYDPKFKKEETKDPLNKIEPCS
jgi:hypothetical protein